ncbi:MAG: YfhO family protein [Candidatus Hydrogenedentes bacterium]|nr:YfhO family protein [Candidatus Hydrogenedentota bacterium]
MSSKQPNISIREYVVHAILVLLIVVALFPKVFFEGDVALPGYVLYQSYPWKDAIPEGFEHPANQTAAEILFQFTVWTHVQQIALANGEWPLWNPYECTGMPLHANYQSLAFYPARLLYVFFDAHQATSIWLLLKFWLMGMTAFYCCRSLCLSPWASRFASTGWMLSAYCMTWTYHAETDVACWLPITFLGAELLALQRLRRGFLTLAFGATLLIFAGHPETALVMGVGVGLYFLIRVFMSRLALRRAVMLFGLALTAWIIALAINAINIIPFAEYLQHSYTLAARATGEARSEYLRPFAIAAYWVPRFTGFSADGNYWAAQNDKDNSHFVSLVYPGMVVWVAIAMLLVKGPKNPLMRSRAVALLIPAALGALFGYRLPFLSFIHDLPLVSSMWGIHHIAFTMFALPMLGAIAIDRWFDSPQNARAVLPACGLLLLMACIVGLSAFFSWPVITSFERIGDTDSTEYSGLTNYVFWQIAIAGIFTNFALVCFALHSQIRRPAILKSALVTLLLCDLLLAARGMRPTAKPDALFPATELTDYLRGMPSPVRCTEVSDVIPPPLLIPYGLEVLWGYDGIFPNRFMQFVELSKEPRVWSRIEPLLDTEYALYPENFFSDESPPPPYFAQEGTFNHIDVYRDTRTGKRARLVPTLAQVGSFDAVLDAMREPSFDPERVAVTEFPVPNAPFGDSDVNGNAVVTTYATTKVAVQTVSDRPCILSLQDAYFPGWRAYIDGAETRVFPVNANFRGIVLPAGEHTVEYSYEPASFRWGLMISSITLALCLLGSLWLLAVPARRSGRPC